jgi:hypothetical protein
MNIFILITKSQVSKTHKFKITGMKQSVFLSGAKTDKLKCEST